MNIRTLMNRQRLVSDTAEVAHRLEQLGWTATELVEVALAMVAARASCTANDPAGAPGWMAWKEGVRRMREIGVSKGWRRIDIDQVPWALDLSREQRFTVVNSTDGAGLTHYEPQNCSRKGSGTERAVSANAAQLDFGFPQPVDQFADDEPLPEVHAGAKAWYLFVYSNEEAVRAELSCPIAISNGYFCGFVERIFLDIETPMPTRKTDDTADAMSEYDIRVERIDGA